MDKKIAAVSAYASQFYDPGNNSPNTPISSRNFRESIEYRAKDLGRLVGVDFAEGFTAERHLAIQSLSDLF
jgi:hypothetical protein